MSAFPTIHNYTVFGQDVGVDWFQPSLKWIRVRHVLRADEADTYYATTVWRRSMMTAMPRPAGVEHEIALIVAGVRMGIARAFEEDERLLREDAVSECSIVELP